MGVFLGNVRLGKIRKTTCMCQHYLGYGPSLSLFGICKRRVELYRLSIELPGSCQHPTSNNQTLCCGLWSWLRIFHVSDMPFICCIIKQTFYSDAAVKLKEKANVLFRKASFSEALSVYKLILQQFGDSTPAPFMRIIRSNLAACFIELGESICVWIVDHTFLHNFQASMRALLKALIQYSWHPRPNPFPCTNKKQIRFSIKPIFEGPAVFANSEAQYWHCSHWICIRTW